MVRNVSKKFGALLFAVASVSCAGDFSADEALTQLRELPEFNESFSAPLALGSEVVGKQGAEDPEGYAAAKYGTLLSEGLLDADIAKANSWRTVLVVSLSESGNKYFDKARTDKYLKDSGDDTRVFMNVCKLEVDRIEDFYEVGDDKVKVDYVIVERDITPFGEFLGYEDGKEHRHSRVFESSTFSWSLLPAEKKVVQSY